MKRDTLTLAKFKRLRRRGEFRTVEAAGILDVLWLFTARNCPDGYIDAEEIEDLAEEMGYTIDEIDPVLTVLAETGWLDPADNGYIVHDWPDHCEDSVHLRLARSGKSFADGTLPKTTKLSKSERERLPVPDEQKEAHDMRTPCAQDAQESARQAHCRSRSRSRSRSHGLCHAVTVTTPEADVAEVHAHHGTERNGKPVPIGAILKVPPSLDAENTAVAAPGREIVRQPIPQPPPGNKIAVESILALTRDPPEALEYWRDVGRELTRLGRIDVIRDGVQRIRTEDGFKRPGAYLNKLCVSAIREAGGKVPKPWNRTA